MIAKTRAVMLELGLVLFRGSAEVVDVAGMHVLRQSYELMDVDSEASISFTQDIPCPERKGMPADKSVLASLTTGLNYALRDLLMLSRGREDQIDAIDDEQFDPARRGQEVVDAALRIMAPADVASDSRVKPGEDEMSRLRRIIASGEAGEGAEQRWLEGASAWMQKNHGIDRKFDDLSQIPSEVARVILARYEGGSKGASRRSA